MFEFNSWVFWITIYWLAVFAFFLEWYNRQVRAGLKPKMHWLVALLSFLMIGPLLPIIIVYSIIKGAHKTKR